MKKLGLIFILLLFTTSGQSQELVNEAPLEFVRPSATPIPMESFEPPEAPAPALAPAPVASPRAVKSLKRRVVKTPPRVVPAGPPKPVKVVMPTKTILPLIRARKTPAVTPAPVAKTELRRKKMKTRKIASAEEEQQQATITGGPRVHTRAPARKASLGHVRFGNIWAMKNGTNSGSFIISWNPVILPYQRFNFGATLGATQCESESVYSVKSDSFLVSEYGLTASYYLSRSLMPELIVGAQTWNTEQASTNLMVAANINYIFKSKPLDVIERLFLGYGSISMDDGNASVIRGGIGFRF